MNRSDRDPDAIDRIREDALTEPQPQWPAPPDGMSATVNAKLQAQAARIAELEAQLAECRKLRTNYAMGVDPVEYNDLYHRAEGEIDSLRAQLAAATERERVLARAVYRAGRYILEHDCADDDGQEAIGDEMVALSGFCDHCGGGYYGNGSQDCDKCKGTGRAAAALAASEKGREQCITKKS